MNTINNKIKKCKKESVGTIKEYTYGTYRLCLELVFTLLMGLVVIGGIMIGLGAVIHVLDFIGRIIVGTGFVTLTKSEILNEGYAFVGLLSLLAVAVTYGVGRQVVR